MCVTVLKGYQTVWQVTMQHQQCLVNVNFNCLIPVLQSNMNAIIHSVSAS